MQPFERSRRVSLKPVLWAAWLLLVTPAFPALAQPPTGVAAQSPAPSYPTGVRVRERSGGFYYADAHGKTLYALNQRVAFTRSGGATPYCVGPCAKTWAEARAPADAKPVGDWSVVDGVDGPQWAYRKNPVFTYRADRAPGDVKGDGYEDLWTVIVHVPPPPQLTAPPVVAPLYAERRYVLADTEQHTLFVPQAKGACEPACAGWTPLLAGLSARDVGAWTVDREGSRARWAYRGKPVFVSPSDKPAVVPDGGQVLVP
jgi:predicted lipoprotein with Yx(FWY)xxD motif